MLSRNTEKKKISNVIDVESPVINFFIKTKDGTKVQSSSSVSLDEVLTFEFNNGKQRSIQDKSHSTHLAFKHSLWVAACTETRTQYLPVH